jgi:hypothetical protein
MFRTVEIGHERGETNESRGEVASFVFADTNDPHYIHGHFRAGAMLRPVN